jgi:putative transposase
MPRQPRLLLPGVAAHIVQRGNNREACFLKESDYLLYLLHLRELAGEHGCAVHAYCLMTNHVHLLLTPRSGESCTHLMRDLGQRYVQYFNRRHGRSGTLWEGRFRSCIADSAPYVVACYRYIELNPVRARMVEHPGAYRWSSYGANAEGRLDPLISMHAELAAIGEDDETRRKRYRALFDEALELSLIERIREATNGGYPLAGETLKSELVLRGGRKLERGRAGRPSKPKPHPTDSSPEIGL